MSNEKARERKGPGAKVPGSERARERIDQGAKVPGSELARVLLADSLRGANGPGSEKAVNRKIFRRWRRLRALMYLAYILRPVSPLKFHQGL